MQDLRKESISEFEKDKSIEELEKRRSELDSRFQICSAKLNSRISRLNANIPQNVMYFFLVFAQKRESSQILKREMQKLENYMQEIATGSSEIWNPITQIENVKIRIENALEKAKALAELRTQTELLKNACEKGEFENACEVIERQKNVQEICIIDNEETKEFDQVKKQFLTGIMQEYENSLKEKNLAKIKRLAKILNRIGPNKLEAGEKYISNIKFEIKEKCDLILKEIALIKNKDISSAEPIFISPYLGQIFG